MSHSSRPPERRKRFAARLTLFFYGAQLLGGCLPSPSSSEGPDSPSRSRSRVQSTIPFDLGPDTILDTGTSGGDAPGITPFTADVTQNGTASVTVPLWVPPGRAGIQPSLSIVYDSQGSDGLLGPGFNLSGLSQITLCPNSFARDDKSIAIDFSPDMALVERDRYTRAYCLDGARLVPSQNEPRSFKTEHDSYASIRIPADSDPQDPMTFEVRGRDGLIRTYGKTLSREDALIQGRYEKLGEGADDGTTIQVTESKTVKLAWALAAVEDHSGNRMDVFYDQAAVGAESGAWHRPARIVYTQFHNDSGTLEPGTREVEFKYGPRTDVFTGYLSGVKVGRNFRLTGIDMKGPGIATGSGSPPTVLLRSYNLIYYSSETSKRSLLTELRECDGKNVCKAPVRFDWEQGSWDFEYPPAQDVSDAAQSVGVHAFGLGAGRQGLAYFVKSQKMAEQDLVWASTTGMTTNFTAQVWEDTMRLLQFQDATSSALAVSNVTGQSLWYPYFNIENTNWLDDAWDAIFGGSDPGDFCGNRAQRNLFPLVTDWDGAGRSTVTSLSCMWDVPKGAYYPAPMYGHTRVGAEEFLVVGSEPNSQFWLDVDGDGRNDRMWMGQHEIDLTGDADSVVPAKRRVVADLASGKKTKESPVGYFQPSRFGLRAVDVDGSGKMSLLGVGPNGNTFLEGLAYRDLQRIGVSPRMDAFKTTIRTPPAMPSFIPSLYASTLDFVDVNGDGLQDAVMLANRSFSDLNPRLTVQLNTGAGFTETRELSLPGDAVSRLLGAKVEHGDFDGDGRVDFAIFKAGQPVQLLLAGTQGNFSTLMALSASPVSSGDNLEWAQVIDVNNDGVLDFTWRQGNSLKVARRTRATDVLKRVHGNTQVANYLGYSGLNYSFEYAPLSQANPHGNVTPSEPFYARSRGDDTGGKWLRWAPESMRVVSRMSLNANDQPQRSWRYLYRDGYSDTTGLGWLGFGERVVVDELTGARTTTVYDNRFSLGEPLGYQSVPGLYYPGRVLAPLAHLPREETVEVPLAGGAKQQTQRTWTYSRSPATYAPTYQQYASRVVETVKEIKGSAVTVVAETETLTELDAYGTPVKSTQLVHGANKTEQVEQVTTVGTLGFDQEMWRPQGTWSVTSSWKSCARSPTVGCEGAADVANVRTQTFKFDGRGQVEIVEQEPSLSGEGSLPPEASETYLKTTFVRDFRGLVYSVMREGGGATRVESVTYDNVDQTQVVSSTDAEGATWKYLFHPGLGVLAQTADPNGVNTRFQYDGFGRPRVVTPLYRGPSVAPGDQSVVRTFYERNGALLQQRTQVAAGGLTPTETITRFDVMGRPVSSQGPRFDGQTVVSSISYDALGRVEKLEAPRTSTESPTWESYQYDALNRVTARRVGDGLSPTGALVESIEYTVPTAYASQTSVTDALGLVKKMVFDYRGLMVAATEAAGTSKAATMAYAYGPFGRLETTDDPQGNRSLNVYDAQGRLAQSVDPSSGTRTYRYNAFGEVKRDADGLDSMPGVLITTYERDRLGRVLSAKNNQEELAYEYDLGMGAMRRLTKATRTVLGGPPEVVTTQHFYDEFGRETDTQQDAAGTSLTVSRQFDDYGRLSRLTYPVTSNGQPVTIGYAYNERGALSSIYRTGAFTTYWAALERDSAGRLKKTRYGNGVERESRYDSRGRLRFLEAKRNGVNVQRLAYEYTANDNLAARHDLMVGVTEKFSYDALDRLEWWRVLQNCQRLETQFQYDSLGNLLSRSPVAGWEPSALLSYTGGTSGGPHAVKQAQLGSDTLTYEYDHRGNQIASRDSTGVLVRTVEYNAFDLPKTLIAEGRTVAFGYDASGTRVRKQSPQEDVLYVGDLYQRRTQGLTTKHLLSIHSPEGVIGELSWDEGASTENVRYFLNDRQGSPDTVTDASGAVVERIKYEPFGARRNVSNLAQASSAFQSGARKGFTGHEHDDELGLINMRGRIYDPRLMKFLSVDPVVADLGSVQAYNAYSYVLNNPTRYTDPSGFTPYGGTLVSRWDGASGGSTPMQSLTMSMVERYMAAPGASPFLPRVDFRVPSVTSLDDAKLVPSGHYTEDVGQSSAPYRSSATSVLNTVSGAVNSEKFSCGISQICHLGRVGANWHLGNLLEASRTYDHYAPVSEFAATALTINHFIPFVDAGESVNKVKPACTNGGIGQCSWGAAKAFGSSVLAGAAIYGMVTSVASGLSRGASLFSKSIVNIDASTVSTFVSEGSFMRHQLKALVSGKRMVMTETALSEVQNMMKVAGPKEFARYQRFLKRISVVPDNPSARALGLKVTKRVGANDIRIFGTADEMGVPTMTGDAKFLRGSSAQGVDFDAILHPSVPLTGQ